MKKVLLLTFGIILIYFMTNQRNTLSEPEEMEKVRAVCFLPLRDSEICMQLEEGMVEAVEKSENLILSVYYYSDFPEMDFSIYTEMAIAMKADYLISFGGTAKDEYMSDKFISIKKR